MEAGLSIPEVVFEVGASLRQGGQFEMRERFAISSSASEAAAEEIGFESPDDCIFWLGNGAYFSPTTGRCMFILGDAYNLWDRSVMRRTGLGQVCIIYSFIYSIFTKNNIMCVVVSF